MSTTKLSLERPRVVCHVDASSTAAAIVKAAGSYCRERDAELVVVWVLEPSSFHTTLPCTAGETGIWGLSGAAAVALELARKEGIAARVVVRIGDAGRVVDEERRASGAERVFTAADVSVEPAATSDGARPRGSSRPRLERQANHDLTGAGGIGVRSRGSRSATIADPRAGQCGPASPLQARGCRLAKSSAISSNVAQRTPS